MKLVSNKNLISAVAYVLRCYPVFIEARKEIRSGRFGEPVEIVVNCGQHFPTYRPAYRNIYYSSLKFRKIAIGERKASCVNDLCQQSLHGGSHAFKDELYHNQQRSVQLESGMFAGKQNWSRITDGSAPRRWCWGSCFALRPRIDFRLGRVPRPGGWALRPRRLDRLGRRAAQNVGCSRTPSERSFDGRHAAPHASSGVGGRYRFAPEPVLRCPVPQPQRNLLRPAEAGHKQVSRLRFGLHRRARSSLYFGPDLGATPRIDRHGFCVGCWRESAKSA